MAKQTAKNNIHTKLHWLESYWWLFLGAIFVASFAYFAAGRHAPPGSNAASGALPFDMPANATLKASGKKVFAHYFTPYPISLDNKTSTSDYYTNGYLNPNGESGKHAAYGGLLRDRPLPRSPISSNYQLEDMKTEVRRATDAGLDGFTVDLLSVGSTSTHWQRVQLLLQAAPLVDSSFKMVLMPDGTASATADINALTAAIGSVKDSSALYKLSDGRVVISPFAPEKQGAAWWQNFVNIMKNSYGMNVALVPCFLNYSANAAAFAPFSYGFSNWGNRSPASNANLAANINDAHARGKIWMQPVSVQDERPNQSIYDEANNTENLRVTWNTAINGADWVQVPTWNDYSEGTQLSPSVHNNWAPLDITSYYITRFKTGSWPTLKRDVLYVSHRSQPYAAKPTGGQTKFMTLRTGSSPARDAVEVLSLLPTAGM
ncbi:MAG: glycoside hydrolase family 71 protein [Candidatus Saccharimonadales bacterium]